MTYSNETLDRIFAETPNGCETSASAIVVMLRAALFTRARELKAAKKAAQSSRAAVGQDGEIRGIPIGPTGPVTGLQRK